MTNQAALIMDTILGMKRTLAQQDESSDSDDPYLQPSNRGKKLKKKARHLSIDGTQKKRGRTSYTKTVDYAGYKRDILRYNPKRYDEDGDVLDSEDEDVEADGRAADENPYADIKLEHLLRPLTSAATLTEHPSLSLPYLSDTLSEMAQQACENMQRERKNLEHVKLLLIRFRGDETWVPTEQLNAPEDEDIFGTAHVYEKIISSSAGNSQRVSPLKLNQDGDEIDLQLLISGGAGNGSEPEGVNGFIREVYPSGDSEAQVDSRELVTSADTTKALSNDMNIELRDGRVNGDIGAKSWVKGRIDQEKLSDDMQIEHSDPDAASGANLEDRSQRQHGSVDHGPEPIQGEEAEMEKTNAKSRDESTIGVEKKEGETKNVGYMNGDDDNDHDSGEVEEEGAKGLEEDENERQPVTRRMRTRAQAQAAPEPTPLSRSPSIEPPYEPGPIHPLFLLPASAKPDPNCGLPAPEAEETRRMLMLYVQKQEEICRSAEQLYEGLLKADRQRLTVLKWCKAEGHVGEMSDGEDWYDKEEWGLEDDLRKGEADERVADEEVGAPGKKTRGRRQ